MSSSIGRLVSILYRKSQVYLNEALYPLGISASELPVILCLFKKCGIAQEEVSAYSSTDKAATARAIQSLIKKGWINKERDTHDKRANKIYLTNKARQAEKQIRTILKRWTDLLEKDQTTADIAIMYNVLENMVDKIKDINVKDI